MLAHLRSVEGQNIPFCSGRRPICSCGGSNEQEIPSPGRRHSRSPGRSRWSLRRSRSAVRGRAARRRLTTSEKSSSASPDPIPERRLTDVRPSRLYATGNSIPTTRSDDVVIGIGMPPGASPVPDGVRFVTVKELAMKMIPLINTLKAQVADLQLTLSVLPSVEQAVKELKEGYLLLEQKCGGCVVHQVKTDAALKLLNQSSLAYDFFFYFPGMWVCPLVCQVCPPWWVYYLMRY